MFRCFEIICEIKGCLSRFGSYVFKNSIMYNFSIFTHILRFVFARGGPLSCVLLKGEFTFLNHEFLYVDNIYYNIFEGV